MGLLQIWGGHGVFFDDDGWRRLDNGGQRRLLAISGSTGSRFLNVISIFFRSLCVRWLGQLSMYSPHPYLYLYASVYVFLIQ
jgi:hypothetical protein